MGFAAVLRQYAFLPQLIAAAALYGAGCAAQQEQLEFRDRRFHVSLEHSARFIRIASQVPVLLVLKPRDADFPAANLIVQAGSYAAGAPLAEQEEAVVRDYHRVGFTSAKPVKAERLEVSGRTAFQEELAYEQDGAMYRSIVTIVPAGDKHFILTYLAPEKLLDTSTREEHAQLLRSFQAPAVQGGMEASEAPRFPWRLIALAFGITVAAAWMVLYRRHSRGVP